MTPIMIQVVAVADDDDAVVITHTPFITDMSGRVRGLGWDVTRNTTWA